MEDKKRVINRDFSSLSIVLDENFVAKIVDFGLSVFLPPNQDVLRLGSRLAYDEMYKMESKDGLAYVACRCFRKGTIMEMIDPIIMEESDDNNFVNTKGPNKDSVDIFVKIAYRCLAETQDQRPTMIDVVKELEKALSFQEQSKYAVGSSKWDNLKDCRLLDYSCML
ncbi:G-type lectin S-receptor-like serine/threonine-protein kinase LECRK3 [Rutidosis leptorrhynchoides]|uniref:G-type lectin S-receptor-like serine/threonine-protein kinase LECRK3 n=1 Tax=Rutidosis leptorrhynchoides TaxID=125765 RepID=UPI003A995562